LPAIMHLPPLHGLESNEVGIVKDNDPYLCKVKMLPLSLEEAIVNLIMSYSVDTGGEATSIQSLLQIRSATKQPY